MSKIAALFILGLIINVSAFDFSQEQSTLIDEVLTLVLNSEFETALAITDSITNCQPENILTPVLHFTALGMRDLDYNISVDSLLFLSSFKRAEQAITQSERENGVTPLSQTLLGFTLSMHASYYLRNRSYWAAYGTGMSAIRTLQNAREMDPSNTEVNFFLGLYDYGRAELRRRFWWVLFWYPGNKESGIRQLELCSENATLTRYAAMLSLSDVYLQEDEPEKSLEIIRQLESIFPQSRFVLWSRAKYYEARELYTEAAKVFEYLAQSYESSEHGKYNATVTRNKQAHMLAESGKLSEAALICQLILDQQPCDATKPLFRDTERLLRRVNGT